MSSVKILWVVPRTFLPISDGASKANDALLSSLPKEGSKCDITLVLFDEKEGTDLSVYKSRYNISKVVVLKKKLLGLGLIRIFQVLKNFVSKEALTPSFFNLKENKQKLKELKDEGYDYVLCDGLHPYCGLKDLFKAAKFIYRSHNVEYDLWNDKDFSGPTKFIINVQKKKIKKLERMLLDKAERVWTIADEDRETYLKDFTELQLKDKIVYLPMSQQFLETSFSDRNKKTFLFVGKLDWQPNTEGLYWLLEKVMPKVGTNVQLKIVGSGQFPKDLFKELSNVEFLGFVESLEDLYRTCTASLIPIFSGSGTRIKVIEALAQGVPLLSTSFGIQGSGMNGEHCFISNSADEWIQLLQTWDSEGAFAKSEKAKSELREIYGTKSFQRELALL